MSTKSYLKFRTIRGTPKSGWVLESPYLDTLKSVVIRSHNCSDPIDYKDDPICVHCGSSNHLTLPAKSDTFSCMDSECLQQRQSYMYFSMLWLHMCAWYCPQKSSSIGAGSKFEV